MARTTLIKSADWVVVWDAAEKRHGDVTDPWMMPARDPLRSLVYTAADRAIRDVYVDGVKVVENRRVLTLDRARALGELAEAPRRMIDAVPQRDYRKRSAEDIAPLSLPML